MKLTFDQAIPKIIDEQIECIIQNDINIHCKMLEFNREMRILSFDVEQINSIVCIPLDSINAITMSYTEDKLTTVLISIPIKSPTSENITNAINNSLIEHLSPSVSHILKAINK